MLTSKVFILILSVTAVGCVFTVSHSFTDPHIVPKWLCLAFGLSLSGLCASAQLLMGRGLSRGVAAGTVFSVIVAVCLA